MTANVKADLLQTKLFDLMNEFKDFSLAVLAADVTRRERSARDEAGSQADAVACALATVYESVSGPSAVYDLFTDAARDQPAYEFELSPADVAESFPAKLRTLRESAGLSVEQLATAAGLTRQAVHNYEAGSRKPTWAAVQSLAKSLGVPTDQLRDH